MLPKISPQSRISHLSLGVALTNLLNGSNNKTNQYHPSKDDFVLDCTSLRGEALHYFPEIIPIVEAALKGDYNDQVEQLSQNGTAQFLLTKFKEL